MSTDPFADLIAADSADREPIAPVPYAVIRARDIARGCTPRTPEEYAADCTARRARPREPWQRSCYPVGCPDPDWCAGNRECHWDCAGLTEDDAP